MDKRLLEHIHSKLGERQLEVQRYIGDGGAKDFSEYQKLCGVIQGLAFAMETITDLANRLEKADDE